MNDRHYLEIAYEEAQKAASKGQIPVGAVVVDEMGQILARGHNRINELNNRTAHAEMLTIFSALEQYDGYMAPTWSIYTTLEPCPMCLGTIIIAKTGRVVWASPDEHTETHKLLGARELGCVVGRQSRPTTHPTLQQHVYLSSYGKG